MEEGQRGEDCIHLFLLGESLAIFWVFMDIYQIYPSYETVCRFQVWTLSHLPPVGTIFSHCWPNWNFTHSSTCKMRVWQQVARYRLCRYLGMQVTKKRETFWTPECINREHSYWLRQGIVREAIWLQNGHLKCTVQKFTEFYGVWNCVIVYMNGYLYLTVWCYIFLSWF